jgi:hypothetical protein
MHVPPPSLYFFCRYDESGIAHNGSVVEVAGLSILGNA